MYVFWNIDFGRISEGFWDGFGRPKSVIFQFFFVIFSMQILECKLEGQKIEKKKLLNFFSCDFPAIFAVSAALGGRIIGWGEACLSLNFKPYLKIGL